MPWAESTNHKTPKPLLSGRAFAHGVFLVTLGFMVWLGFNIDDDAVYPSESQPTATAGDTLESTLQKLVDKYSTSKECGTGVRASFDGKIGSEKYFSLACSNGTDYGIMVSSTEVIVAYCSTLEAVGVECFKQK